MATKKTSSKKAPARKSARPRRAAKVVVATASVRVSMTVTRSNYCEDHGVLLRADRTCPISDCRFHETPMP